MDNPLMPTPEVSVIMPAFNSCRYISTAIDSVLNQTFKNFELIIIDDGSTDSTVTIISNYLSHENRIVLLHQSHQGVSCARNFGIKTSKSPFIAFLDSDDYWHPEYLTKMLLFQKLHQTHVVSCFTQVFSSSSGKFQNIIGKAFPNQQDALREFFFSDNFIHINGTLVKKKALISVDSFNSNLRFCEDYDLWLRLYEVECTFCFLPEVLAFYRNHVDSTANKNILMMVLAALNVRKQKKGWKKLSIKSRFTIYLQSIYRSFYYLTLICKQYLQRSINLKKK